MNEIATRVLAGERRAVARACTLVEAGRAPDLLRLLQPGHSLLIGITGAPGAGKSTFTDQLIQTIRADGKTVAVLAVDPSSMKTGGALLGDRIRMQRHYQDPGVFIRSMATRGAMGGLAPTTRAMTAVFDAAGFDVVLVETVGVGQDEIDVAAMAQVVAVLLVPGQGDEIQAIKSGIMEIADLFVINKADLPGAEKLFQEIEAEVHGVTPVLKTVAATGQGMAEVWARLQSLPRRVPRTEPPRFAIDHLGIAVSSLDEALRFYQDALGMGEAHRETVAGEKVDVAMLQAGESRIELLQPSEPGSTIARFLEKRGPGLHHIALRVPDLQAAAARLQSHGARLLNEPRIGAGGHRYVFIHPASTGGVLLELIEEHS
ncbi:methylmalonyl Co-A mutase-associated GTPase MeaB [Bryobacter aggregatus]|uniref:methylmalonyl Co-A mutase-associated GTPase MeaB n=1 Tax=Bryobacter aggregatus TaxID=360054 RepID=UPI00056CE095|nr:methylmalonyl Co-A mutase-associated GTPase MeaB [Bryobacter aggregatus]